MAAGVEGDDSGLGRDFALARYDIPSAVAVQSNGRIVVAGLAASAQGDHAFEEDFALARYDRHGRLDTTFGVDGKVTADTGGGNDGAQAVALQADGKIVAAGTPGFTLVRYLGRPGGEAPTDGRRHVGLPRGWRVHP